MLRRNVVKILVSVVLVVSVFFSGVVAYACDLDGFSADNVTNWKLHEDRQHMGKKYTTYRYEDSSVQSTYSSYVNGGIAIWGSAITCVFMLHLPATLYARFMILAQMHMHMLRGTLSILKTTSPVGQ